VVAFELQPHESSSETVLNELLSRWDYELQPHESSSETSRRPSRRSPDKHFNLTRVRLKPTGWLRVTSRTRYFNLTRVRLKPGDRRRTELSESLLQPHESSSETIGNPFGGDVPPQLQPHESSSETLGPVLRRDTFVSLQPHESSSETWWAYSQRCGSWNFNLTRVRLKRDDALSAHAACHTSTSREFV